MMSHAGWGTRWSCLPTGRGRSTSSRLAPRGQVSVAARRDCFCCNTVQEQTGNPPSLPVTSHAGEDAIEEGDEEGEEEEEGADEDEEVLEA